MRTNNILAVLCDQFTSTLPAAEARRTQYDFGRPILIGQDQIVYQPICSVYSDVYRLSQPTTIQAVTTFDNFR
jgi:hypothetical protein